MAKKKPAPKKPDPYAPYRRQAVDAADLRYGGEIDALRLLRDTAEGSYQQGRSQSAAAARSIIAAAESSRPNLASLMERVGQYSGATTAKVAPVPGSGLANEASIQANNLGLTAQSALSQLEMEKVRAAQAGAFQGAKVRDEYRSDLGKIQDRATSIARDHGTFAQDTLAKLLEARADRKVDYARIRKQADTATQQQLTSLLSAGVNPDGSVIKGGPKDPAVKLAGQKPTAPPKPPKPAPGTPGAASQASVTKFNQTLGTARNYVRLSLKKAIESGGMSIDRAMDILTNGAVDPTTKAKIIGTKDPVAARAALELELHGAIGGNTTKEIHKQGIRVRDVGVKAISQREMQARAEKRRRIQRNTTRRPGLPGRSA